MMNDPDFLTRSLEPSEESFILKVLLLLYTFSMTPHHIAIVRNCSFTQIHYNIDSPCLGHAQVWLYNTFDVFQVESDLQRLSYWMTNDTKVVIFVCDPVVRILQHVNNLIIQDIAEPTPDDVHNYIVNIVSKAEVGPSSR